MIRIPDEFDQPLGFQPVDNDLNILAGSATRARNVRHSLPTIAAQNSKDTPHTSGDIALVLEWWPRLLALCCQSIHLPKKGVKRLGGLERNLHNGNTCLNDKSVSIADDPITEERGCVAETSHSNYE